MSPEGKVLRLLNGKKTGNLLELSEELEVNPLEAYGAIRRLEKQGLIRIYVGEDG
jgi:DNA-binding MarR family transcriptional regulator